MVPGKPYSEGTVAAARDVYDTTERAAIIFCFTSHK